MLQKLKRFKPSKTIKKLLKITLFILIFDVLIAILGPYLGANVPFLSDKSAMRIMSDLLFLEGAVIFTVGAFLEASTVHTQKETTTDGPEGSHKKRLSLGVLSMILGACLIGLSIIIGVSIYA